MRGMPISYGETGCHPRDAFSERNLIERLKLSSPTTEAVRAPMHSKPYRRSLLMTMIAMTAMVPTAGAKSREIRVEAFESAVDYIKDVNRYAMTKLTVPYRVLLGAASFGQSEMRRDSDGGVFGDVGENRVPKRSTWFYPEMWTKKPYGTWGKGNTAEAGFELLAAFCSAKGGTTMRPDAKVAYCADAKGLRFVVLNPGNIDLAMGTMMVVEPESLDDRQAFEGLLRTQWGYLSPSEQAERDAAKKRELHAQIRMAEAEQLAKAERHERDAPKRSEIGARLCRGEVYGRTTYQLVGFVEARSPDNGKVKINVTSIEDPRSPGTRPGGWQPFITWESPDNWTLC